MCREGPQGVASLLVARRDTGGQRRAIIRHAFLAYHGGKISFVELARVIATFGAKKPHTG